MDETRAWEIIEKTMVDLPRGNRESFLVKLVQAGHKAGYKDAMADAAEAMHKTTRSHLEKLEAKAPIRGFSS